MVGVTGFEPAASTSQMSRAPNCATPRFLFNFLCFCVEVGQTVVKLKIHAFLSFRKTPKVRINKGFSKLSNFYGISHRARSQTSRSTRGTTLQNISFSCGFAILETIYTIIANFFRNVKGYSGDFHRLFLIRYCCSKAPTGCRGLFHQSLEWGFSYSFSRMPGYFLSR